MLRALVAVAALLVGALSAYSAYQALGRPFASLLVDPYGDFSHVFLPSWNTAELKLSVGDRIVSLDRKELRGHGLLGARLDRDVAALAAAGSDTVEVGVARDDEVRLVSAKVRRMGPVEVWWFWGLYLSVAVGVLWSGLVAHRIAGRRPGANAHLFLSFSAFVFLTTFFDYHTTRLLTPLFAAATLGNAAALLAVALYFPAPWPLPTWGKSVERALAALLVVGMSALALDAIAGWDLRALRMVVTTITPLPLLALGGLTLLRMRSAAGRDRKELISALWGVALAPILIAVGFVLMLLTGDAFFHVVLPFGVLAFPLSVAYSLLRHNILGTGQLVTRGLFLAPALAAGLCAGGSAWAVAYAYEGLSTASVLAGIVGFVGGCGVVWRYVERSAFLSATRFRPTVERLADGLSATRDPEKIRANLVQMVRDLLLVERVEVQEEESTTDASIVSLPVAGGLSVPLRTGGESLGSLVVWPRESGAPFTDEDVHLLETLASLCAVGLRNARSLSALEELRVLERAAGSEGQRVTMDLLGAELAHEVAYPLNYFRHLLDRLGRGRGYDDTDVEIGREEVDRLGRMLNSLRSLQAAPQTPHWFKVARATERAVALVRAEAEERRLIVVVETPEQLAVFADFDRTLQLLANLLRNAVQAAPVGGNVSVRAQRMNGELLIEVRDDGGGIPHELAERVFRPFVSGKSGGTGLGLAVSQRIARGFGWSLDHEREQGWTVFRVRAPFKEPPAA